MLRLPESLIGGGKEAAPTDCIRPDLASLEVLGPDSDYRPPDGASYAADLTGDGSRSQVVFFLDGRIGGDGGSDASTCLSILAAAWGFRILAADGQVVFEFEDPELRAILRGSGVWDINGDGRPEIVLFGLMGPEAGCRLHVFRWNGSRFERIGIDPSRRFYGFRLGDLDGDGRPEITIAGFHPTPGDFPEVFRWDGVGLRERTELYPSVYEALVTSYLEIANDDEEADGTRLLYGLLAAYGRTLQGRHAEALAQLSDLAALADPWAGSAAPPVDDPVAMLRGHVLYQQRRYAEALETYGASAPRHVQAAALLSEGRPAEALALLGDATRPRDEEDFLLMAEGYQALGRPDLALLALKSYVTEEPLPTERCRTLRRVDLRPFVEVDRAFVAAQRDACGSWSVPATRQAAGTAAPAR